MKVGSLKGEDSKMYLDKILQKSMEEIELSDKEIKYLLEQTHEENINKIFSTARGLRKKYFGKKVFLYGFIYFSTYCKNDCNFCYFRGSNTKPPRYRKSLNEIITTAKKLQKSGVHLIDLTMGEDSYYINNTQKLVNIVSKVKKETELPIMVSPGVVNDEVIDELIYAGADWYALYQETHNKVLYEKLRANQDYDLRFRVKKYARNKGMLIEEGLLAGVGNSVLNTVESFDIMKKLNVSQIRTMTFIPQEGTPMENWKQTNFLSELLNIAVMRLIFPNLLIPASLDVDGLKGLEERLDAGANVITSIIPPNDGYAGVANASNDINEGFRTVEGIQETLARCGLNNATLDEYKNWVENQKLKISIEGGRINDKSTDYRWKIAGNRNCLSSKESRVLLNFTG
ncbi:UNVERIFIED_CONTAM: pyrrolysine biosynthesis protein PylB [Acetivibrio alkalicellulosi]